jgi:Bacterial Ig-like domain (group 3)
MPSTMKKYAAAGAVGVMTVATMLAAGGTAASAADTTVASSYTCVTIIGNQVVPVSTTINLPETAVTGRRVASRPVGMTVTIPDSLRGLLGLIGVTSLSGTATEINYLVGTEPVPMDNVVAASTPVPAAGDMPMQVTGTAGSFKAGLPGEYPVQIPATFNFNPVDQAGNPLPGSPLTCTRDAAAPDVLGTLTVTKAPSRTTAKVRNAPITTTKRAKVGVSVGSNGKAATGKITAKRQGKVIARATLNKRGSATLQLPRLGNGKKTITVVYGGSKVSLASSDRVTVRVHRR